MFNDVAKRLARALGLEVRRFHPASSPAAQLRAMLAAHHVNLVFDVGANTGQFGRELRWHVGYRVESFHSEAMSTAPRRAEPQGGRGRTVGSGGRARRWARNPGSSRSTLRATRSAVPSCPCWRFTPTPPGFALLRYRNGAHGHPRFPGARLFQGRLRALLKIDTQGYESQVLMGAPKMLNRVVGVQLELSLIPLYSARS